MGGVGGGGLQQREMILTCWITAQIFWLGAEQKFRTTIEGFFWSAELFFFFNELFAHKEQNATFFLVKLPDVRTHCVSAWRHLPAYRCCWQRPRVSMSALSWIKCITIFDNCKFQMPRAGPQTADRCPHLLLLEISSTFWESLLSGTNMSFRMCGAVLPGTPPDLWTTSAINLSYSREKERSNPLMIAPLS